MPRKIKIVDVVSKIAESPIVEIPNEPQQIDITPEIPPEIPPEITPEPIKVEEPIKIEEAIRSEDDVKIIGNQEELKQNKAPTGTCELCGKTMLLKKPKICSS